MLLFSIFKKLGRNVSELVGIDITICCFNRRASPYLGVIPIRLRVEDREKEITFFSIDITASFNALLGRDWLHRVEAILSMLHQELIFWHSDKLEVVKGDSSSHSRTNIQTLFVNAKKTTISTDDLSLAQRYKLGDLTVGSLREPSEMFDFLVSYVVPHRPSLPIIPSVWDQGEEVLLEEEKVQGDRDLQLGEETIVEEVVHETKIDQEGDDSPH